MRVEMIESATSRSEERKGERIPIKARFKKVAPPKCMKTR